MSGFNPYDDNGGSKDDAPAYAELSDLFPYTAPPYEQPLPTPTVSLAPGWTEYLTEEGLPYYVNSQTNVTQWTKPTKMGSQPPSPTAPHPKAVRSQSNNHTLQTNEPKLKVNRVNFKTNSEQHTGALSHDPYDESNITDARHQYDHAQPYNSDSNYRFLDVMGPSSTRRRNTSTRECSHLGRQAMWWVFTVCAIGFLVLALVGHLLPDNQTYFRSDHRMLFTIIGWSFWGGLVSTSSILILVNLCFYHNAWSKDSIFSRETTKATLYGLTCCMSTPIDQAAGWTTQKDFAKVAAASRRAVPTLTLKFEQYRYTVGKDTRVTLSKTITVPIVTYKDISPPSSSGWPFCCSSLVDVTFHYNFKLPPEQSSAVDYIRKLMIQKWGQDKDKYFKITTEFTCTLPPGPNYVSLPTNTKVYRPDSDSFGTMCCFNPIMTMLWMIISGCPGPFISYFYWSLGAKMDYQIVKAIQIGEIPPELLDEP